MRATLISVVIAFAVFAWSTPLSGQASKDGLRTFEKEVEVWSNGKETVEDLIARAKNEARQEIVLQANGVDIKSTSVANMGRMLFDLIKASSKGHIVNETWQPPDGQILQNGRLIGWKVLLHADVAPPPPDSTLGVKVAIDPKSPLVTGDQIRVTVTTTEDAYIHIFNMFGDGKVTVLLPNQRHPKNFLSANTSLTFPSAQEEQEGIRLKTMLLPNQADSVEQILVIATKKNVNLIGADFKEAFIFKDFNPDDTGSFAQLEQKLLDLSGGGLAEDDIAYRIIRR